VKKICLYLFHSRPAIKPAKKVRKKQKKLDKMYSNGILVLPWRMNIMEKKKISLNIPVEVLDRLDKLAETADMDRSRLIVNLLDEFSKTLMATRRVGLLQLSVLIRDAGETLKQWAKKVSQQTKFKGIEIE
jgi:hypothetical protein